jgi:hypothetical protein
MKYTIPSSVSSPCRINVSVYDITGRCIRNLVNELQRSGSYEINWDRTNAGGKLVAGGVYIVRLRSKAFIGSIKLNLIK